MAVVIRLKDDGQLDSQFGAGGVYSGYPQLEFLGIDRRSNIYLGGSGTSSAVFETVRIKPDGSGPDPNFGASGTVRTDFASTAAEGAGAIAFDSRGRIVLGGGAGDGRGTAQFALARYAYDGALDPSFDRDGKVLTQFFSSATESINAVCVDASDRIVAAGMAQVGSSQQFALARYREDGALDLSFDADGKVLTDFRSSSREYAFGVAIDTRGRAVAAGWAQVGGLPQFALARYLDDGSLDPSFDGDGKVLTDFRSSDGEVAYAIAVDRQGRVVVAGAAAGQIALARYTEDGSLDPSFDGDGKVLTNFASTAREDGSAIAIDARNRVVVAGSAGDNMRRRIALARYAEDGSLDPSFDGDGKVLVPAIEAQGEVASAVSITDDGDIVVGGRPHVVVR